MPTRSRNPIILAAALAGFVALGSLASIGSTYATATGLAEGSQQAAAIVTAKTPGTFSSSIEYRFRDRKGHAWSGSQSLPAEALEGLSPGQAVMVRYNPDRPAYSAIDSAELWRDVYRALMVMLAGFAGLGLVSLTALRSKPVASSQPDRIGAMPAAA